jgi:HEPN domain-containing protein
LTELPVPPPPELIERAKVLDNYYVPTRYPNGHVEGAPYHHYGPIQSRGAIEHADAILEFVRAEMAG